MGVKEIIHILKKEGITGYEIAKATGLTEVGVNKILAGKTKKPHTSTVAILRNYIDQHLNTNKKKTLDDFSIEEIVAYLHENEENKKFNENTAYKMFLKIRLQREVIDELIKMKTTREDLLKKMNKN
ncbi:hypothetical protein [Leptobacterium sp. I13]|uniref:hypothetical protein n=1 Tax=Leptobacterium meishanense TaxID=3128904 RepID=UPI0030EDF6B8